jgi:hypothetical protein
MDPMLQPVGAPKRTTFDHIPHYRTCKKQLQQATQILNSQQQFYFENYLQQFSHQSPYKKYLNTQGQQPAPAKSPGAHNRQKRNSNVYEYHFNNFDLNSINEDSSNES